MFENITVAAQKLLHAVGEDAAKVRFTWQRPLDPDHGDLSTTVALQLSKILKRPPREIAEELAATLKDQPDIERVEVAGAGYVNVWLRPHALLRELAGTRRACTPAVTRARESPVIIDYCGPNIAKPLGIHHILSHVVGQAMINLYRHDGYNVIGWSYPGDWGTQFGKLAIAYERWGSGKTIVQYSVDELLALYVRFHQEAEKDSALEDQARRVFADMEAGDKNLRTFWQQVVEISRKDLEKLYARLQIHVDVETGESFYEDKMAPILEEGQKKGVVTQGEGGALIIAFPPDMQLPSMMLRKSDGSTLYVTRDLAMVRYRLDIYHPQSLYYVVDIAQSLHFKQLEAACRLLGWQLPEFEHVYFGRMRFVDKSMSTRKGTVLKLEEVLDEAVERARTIIRGRGEAIQSDNPAELAEMMGIGALVYGILSQNRKMDIVFDWDRMLSFEGNSAPYLQYTYARACSVLRKAAAALDAMPQVTRFEDHERSVLMTLLQFPSVLDDARSLHLPHTLAHYLHTLCQRFNAFYNALPILQSPPPARELRLLLTEIVAEVLRTGAMLLTLRLPERM